MKFTLLSMSVVVVTTINHTHNNYRSILIRWGCETINKQRKKMAFSMILVIGLLLSVRGAVSDRFSVHKE